MCPVVQIWDLWDRLDHQRQRGRSDRLHHRYQRGLPDLPDPVDLPGLPLPVGLPAYAGSAIVKHTGFPNVYLLLFAITLAGLAFILFKKKTSYGK